MAAKFGLFVDEDHIKLPTLYWLPKLHKRPYKSRFIVSSKIYDKRDDFNFEIVNSHFLMETFVALLPMVYIFLSLFVLLEYVPMSMTSTTETYF